MAPMNQRPVLNRIMRDLYDDKEHVLISVQKCIRVLFIYLLFTTCYVTQLRPQNTCTFYHRELKMDIDSVLKLYSVSINYMFLIRLSPQR